MKVAIVYNEPLTGVPDSEDVLGQVKLVADASEAAGYDSKPFPFCNKPSSPHFYEEICLLFRELEKFSPAVIFNLVESFGSNQKFHPVIASLFESHGYAYTGSSFDAILTSTDKILTKTVLTAYGIPTPLWEQYRKGASTRFRGAGHSSHIPGIKKKAAHMILQDNEFQTSISPPWIIKPAWEDASVGIDDSSVFDNADLLIPKLSKMYSKYNGQPILIEEYIDGREFNVSVLEHSDNSVEVLPVAEQVFANWPEGKPRIINYNAKWDSTSFEYNNTVRQFNPENVPLDSIRDLALKCWSIFNIKGYARVDMRMDKRGRILVVEINANPCIAPDSGFIMAAKEAGYSSKDVVEEIIVTAVKNHKG